MLVQNLDFLSMPKEFSKSGSKYCENQYIYYLFTLKVNLLSSFKKIMKLILYFY